VLPKIQYTKTEKLKLVEGKKMRSQWIHTSLSQDKKNISVQCSPEFQYSGTGEFLEVLFCALTVYLEAQSQPNFLSECKKFENEIGSLSEELEAKMSRDIVAQPG
jgi:hypothetical protein